MNFSVPTFPLQWVFVAVVFLLVSGCQKKATQRKNVTVKRDTSPVIATVGKLTISANEFRQRYKARANKKLTPEQYLEALKEEKLLINAARAKQLHNAKSVRKAGEKMAILIALRSGFAKYFSPSMVKESILKEQYKYNPQEFNRPVLTRVVHLLARFPRSSNSKDPSIQKKEKKALPALLEKAKLLSQKLLEAIRKEKIKTWQEFESFGRRQMKQLNRPDERLQTWFNGLRSFLKVQKTKATPAFWKQVKRRKHALLPLTFCAYCPQIVRLLDQFINRNENIHKTIQTGEIKRLLTQLNYKANSKVEFVRYERLPGFPRKAQAPFPAMVDPFAKATYELKDGTYSQAPVKTSFGYHIIFRVETAKAHHVPYKIARKRILEAVYRGLKRKKFIAWTKLKFHEHKIDVNLAKLKRMSKLKR